MPAERRPSVSPAAPGARQSLFRPETGRAHYSAFSEVSVLAPASLWVAAAAVLGILGALVAATFAVRVPDVLPAAGVLMPQGGIVDVTAPAAGVISALPVKAGDRVAADAIVAELERDRSAPGEPSLAAQTERSYEAQAVLLDDIEARRETLVSDQAARLVGRAGTLSQERDRKQQQARLLNESAALLEARVARLTAVGAAGGIAQDDIDRARREWVGARAAQLAAESEAASLTAEASALLATRDELLSEAAIGRLEHSMRRHDLARIRAEAAVEGSRAIRAAVAGRVLHVHRAIGESVTAGSRLVSLMPPGRVLEAWLYLDVADAAGLEPGTTLQITAIALPKERYGNITVTVLSVSRVSIQPGETPLPLGRLAAAFEVRARIDNEADRAVLESMLPGFGTPFEASVVRRRPRLIDWILEALRTGAGSG